MLDAIAKTHKSDGSNPTTLGFDPVAGGQAELWIPGQGGRLMDGEGAPTLDDPANIEALTMLKEIYDAQRGYAKVKSFSDSFDTFGKDHQSPYSQALKISAVPFKDKEGSPYTVAAGTSFVIPAGARNADAACAWMTFLVTDYAWSAAGAARSEKIASTGGINAGLFTGPPSADKMIRDKFVKASGDAGFDETIAAYYAVLPAGKSLGASPAGQTIKTEVNNAVASALLGTKTPDKALADAQAAAKRAFDQAGS